MELSIVADTTMTEVLLTQYEKKQGVYSDLSAAASTLLSDMIKASDLQIHSVTYRSKDRESLAQKIVKPDKAYRDLAEITDLAAVRITTYFAEDVDRVAEIVEREFEIDSENSIDKRTLLDPDRFGYQSLHYVASVGKQRAGLIEYKRFQGLKLEIQIRSILQHAWAEIEHDLGYKSASGVPREIRRRFSRIAGLLELADAEFSTIRRELADYTAKVPDNIRETPEDVGIDKVSLQALAETKGSSTRMLSELIASVAGATLVSSDGQATERLIDYLRFVNIQTIASLEDAATKKREIAKAFASRWLQRSYETLPDTIGILYLVYVLIAETQDRATVKSFVNASLFAEKEHMPDRLLETYRAIMTSTARE